VRGSAENSSITELVDELLIELGRASGWNRPGRALAALGGYGRGQLAPWSDVDLLFLTGKRSLKIDVDSVLYPLWDLELEVGHALRTPKDCAIVAGQDLTAATALMDARLLMGDEALFNSARKSVELKPGSRAAKRRIAAIAENVETRHERFGSICSLLEPHLKEGKGGLRDLQACRWVLACLGNDADKYFNDRGCSASIQEAERFIFRSRNALHIAAGRKTDHLTFEYHDETASAVLPEKPIDKFFEALHRASHRISSAWKEVADAAAADSGMIFDFAFSSPRNIIDENTAVDEMFKCCSDGKEFPPWLTKWLREADDFASGRAVQRCAIKTFKSRPPLHPLLLELHRLGKLSLFSTDLARVVHQVNYDARHAFTTGIHCIEALKAVEELCLGLRKNDESYLTALANSLPRPGAVRLAALCHDLGKIHGVDGHAAVGVRFVKALAQQLEFCPDDAEFAATLVLKHHLITGIAFGDDLENPASWQKALDGAKNVETLDALTVLSYADLRAVNPFEWTGVWTSWKRDLLVTLHSRARNADSPDGKNEKSSSKRHAAEISEELLKRMPVREANQVPPDLLEKLLSLHASMGNAPAAWHMEDRSHGITEILGVVHSMPRVLSSITGLLALRGFNILSVQLHSWTDGTLHVWMKAAHPGDGKANEALARDLTRSVTGEIDSRPRTGGGLPNARDDALPVQTRVRFLPSESPFYSSLEVRCRDRTGLLRDLTRVFEELAVTVEYALVTTHGPMAQDVFQLKDIFGRKIDSAAKKKAITQEVEKAVEG